MGEPHRIHLGGAWEPPAADRPQSPWTRRFGRPPGLDAVERVWLVIERPAPCTIELNGVSLGAVGPGCRAWRREITRLLTARNVLVLTPVAAVAAADMGGGRCGLPAACGRPLLEIDAPQGSEAAPRRA